MIHRGPDTRSEQVNAWPGSTGSSAGHDTVLAAGTL